MQCPVCGTRIEKDWGFCPRCGTRISGDFFDEIFSRMRKELAEMNKLLEKDIEAFDLSPWFRDMDKKKVIPPRGSGFTIKIVHSGDRKPEVSVRAFGNVDRTKLRKEMGELGVWQPSLGNQNSGKSEFSHAPAKPKPPELVIKGPVKTEEPKTSVARSASKVIVSIELPGVKTEGNIEVSELESSVEVKALADDKAYFKILTKPPRFRLARKSFEKGVLHLEFS